MNPALAKAIDAAVSACTIACVEAQRAGANLTGKRLADLPRLEQPGAFGAWLEVCDGVETGLYHAQQRYADGPRDLQMVAEGRFVRAREELRKARAALAEVADTALRLALEDAAPQEVSPAAAGGGVTA